MQLLYFIVNKQKNKQLPIIAIKPFNSSINLGCKITVCNVKPKMQLMTIMMQQ